MAQQHTLSSSGCLRERRDRPAGRPRRHAVDPAELALCQRLATEAAGIMEGVDVGMGSESSDPFQAFFIAANVDEPVHATIDESLVRSKFGDTIFPLATISVEPLAEAGAWWSEVTYDGSESGKDYLRPSRTHDAMVRGQPAFVDSAFIRIGDRRALWDVEAKKDELPRVGDHLAASSRPGFGPDQESEPLAGLFGYSVQT